jgi:NAD(P) transhydrogenase subunit alpha
MRTGSVIVDLAIEQGGNVEGAVAGEIVSSHGVLIVAHRNVPSRVAGAASALFARNLFNFIAAFWSKDSGRLTLPLEDEIVRAVRLTQSGRIVNERLLPHVAPA